MNELLNEKYQKALKVVKEVIGENVVNERMKNILSVGISPRATSRHGVCKYKGNNCIIEISKNMLQLEEKEILTTLIHEILHTFKDTKGHNAKWKMYAEKISNNTDYKITRCRNIKELEKDTHYNYEIKCNGCGQIWKRQRLNEKYRKQLENRNCICGKCKSKEFIVKEIRYEN